MKTVTLLALALWAFAVRSGAAETTPVSTVKALRAALNDAQPGAVIEIAPGEYPDGVYVSRAAGTDGKPITITGKDPANPPVFAKSLQFVAPRWITLENIVIDGVDGNGLNIDDGGDKAGGANHIVLRNIVVRNSPSGGNLDGIKLSGLVDFLVQGCTVADWGAGGSGIDMVGCRNGIIEGSTFRVTDRKRSNAVQAKGGTQSVVIMNCVIDGHMHRGINIGGSTGREFFRPGIAGFEARHVAVLGNRFDRTDAPLAFVGAIESEVVGNTILNPDVWLFRILQETVGDDFRPCANNVFSHNLVVFNRAKLRAYVNVGANTAPETFVFEENFWYATDNPAASKPSLPTPEKNGVAGIDPRLGRPGTGKWDVAQDGPAGNVGAHSQTVQKLFVEKYASFAPWAAETLAKILNTPPSLAPRPPAGS